MSSSLNLFHALLINALGYVECNTIMLYRDIITKQTVATTHDAYIFISESLQLTINLN